VKPYVVLVVTVAVLFYVAMEVASRSTDQPQPISQPQALSQPATATAQTSTRHGLGEDFAVGYWSYRCNGARWQRAIVSAGGYTIETPDAAFLIVDLTIRNLDRTASILPPLELVDAQNREYDESSKGIFMPGSFDMLKKLNPTVSSRGYVVFDAPTGEYSLKVSGGLESGTYSLVDLSSESH
jgi:hypothetical protein